MILLQCQLDPHAIHTPFYIVLDTFGPWLHVDPTTWFISTSAHPNTLAAALRHLFREESFSVRELDSARLAEFPDAARVWLATQRRREFQRNVSHVLDPACRACISLNCEDCASRAPLFDSPR